MGQAAAHGAPLAHAPLARACASLSPLTRHRCRCRAQAEDDAAAADAAFVVPDDAPLDGSAKSAKGGAKGAAKAAAKGKGAPSADVVVAELSGKRKLTVGSFKGQAR